MTLNELYRHCSSELNFTGCSDFEAMCIFEDILGIKRNELLLSDSVADEQQLSLVKNAVKRRQNGEPLQYIIGKWDFYDLTFSVGPGVLIPRPETELLVDFILEKAKHIDNPVVIDLCSGSGCIGLTVASHNKFAKVYLVEKEMDALRYLNENKATLEITNSEIIKGDIFKVSTDLFETADIIVSNPPYIKTEEIKLLQKEVQNEPITALDGGNDGLSFYKCIRNRWLSKVKKGGYVALECGENQSSEIIDIFNGNYSEKNVIFDFNNIDRIVTFRI